MKKFLGIVSFTLIITILSAYAVMGKTLNNDKKVMEDAEIILSTHSVLKTVLDGNTTSENGDDVEMGADAEYKLNKAVRGFVLSDINGKTSLLKDADKSFNYIVPIDKDNTTIGMITMKYGRTEESLTKSLKNSKMKSEQKEKLVKKEKKREGQLYVSSIRTIKNNQDMATIIFDEEAIKNLLYENGYENINNGKYIHFEKYNILAYVFKKGNDEYVIPYDAAKESIFSEDVYEANEFIEMLLSQSDD